MRTNGGRRSPRPSIKPAEPRTREAPPPGPAIVTGPGRTPEIRGVAVSERCCPQGDRPADSAGRDPNPRKTGSRPVSYEWYGENCGSGALSVQFPHDGNAHRICEIAVADRILAVPAHGPEHDLPPEVTSLEVAHASTPLHVPPTVQQPGELCNRANAASAFASATTPRRPVSGPGRVWRKAGVPPRAAYKGCGKIDRPNRPGPTSS